MFHKTIISFLIASIFLAIIALFTSIRLRVYNNPKQVIPFINQSNKIYLGEQLSSIGFGVDSLSIDEFYNYNLFCYEDSCLVSCLGDSCIFLVKSWLVFTNDHDFEIQLELTSLGNNPFIKIESYIDYKGIIDRPSENYENTINNDVKLANKISDAFHNFYVLHRYPYVIISDGVRCSYYKKNNSVTTLEDMRIRPIFKVFRDEKRLNYSSFVRVRSRYNDGQSVYRPYFHNHATQQLFDKYKQEYDNGVDIAYISISHPSFKIKQIASNKGLLVLVAVPVLLDYCCLPIRKNLKLYYYIDPDRFNELLNQKSILNN